MERTAFLLAADRYKDTIYRIALNWFGNRYDAEDMVQDVLLKLLTCRKVFENDEHLRNYLIRVTVNSCKSSFRSLWRNRRVALDQLPDAVAVMEEKESELFLSVMAMPEKYRVVLYLFYYEELSVREMADILHIKVSAVTTRLSRAREKLRSKLTEGCEYARRI